MALINVKEELLRRIHSNRRQQTEIVESMLGQFGGTDTMRALGKELAKLEGELKVMDTQPINNTLHS